MPRSSAASPDGASLCFDYEATNEAGAPRKGQLRAASERDALYRLQREGLLPLKLVEAPAAPAASARKTRMTAALRLQAMQELTSLLQADIPIGEALQSLLRGHAQTPLGGVFDALYSALRQGGSFTGAIEASGLGLPAHILQLIRAGEESGELAEAFDRALRQLTYMEEMRQEFRNALIYPSVLVLTGILAVGLIFAIVVPKFANLLSQGGDKVPLLSRVVLELGLFVNANWYWLLLGVALLLVLALSAFRQPAWRARIEQSLLRLPVLGDWLRQTQMGRWTQSLGTLLASRVSLAHALSLSIQAVGIHTLHQRLLQVRSMVRGGKSLADALQLQNLLDPMEANLLRVGERSGTSSRMLLLLSGRYHAAARQRMKRFLTLLEPLSILLIGATIGVLMIAIMLAITSVNEIVI
ncbi:MAG: type II secretion system F family protein [Gammaproteobacteria bacterium]|nr:type II secretion system F family protein [Gammaproteobacteria bacterium]